MAPVSGIRGSSVDHAFGGPRDEAVSSRPSRTGRALIPLQPVARTEPPQRTRPQAGFLAQLIATDHDLPQTRARRRGEPEDAIAAYAAAGAKVPSRTGRTVFRTT